MSTTKARIDKLERETTTPPPIVIAIDWGYCVSVNGENLTLAEFRARYPESPESIVIEYPDGTNTL